jgi:hypothetical protein
MMPFQVTQCRQIQSGHPLLPALLRPDLNNGFEHIGWLQKWMREDWGQSSRQANHFEADAKLDLLVSTSAHIVLLCDTA